jgi:valyl-tRNA synthetase
MDKTYKPSTLETHWRHAWEHAQLNKKRQKGPGYCIMLPPPNVTGTLHMGHGFQQTLMDALIRYHRMLKFNTLWQAGTDHAGIATQMVVERQLQRQGKSRHDLGRDAFVEAVWQWRQVSGDQITHQMKRLGVSIDWDRARFTMDEGMTRATYEAFIRLHQEGLIYRGQKLVNWDPKLLTAISDLEVETEEAQGYLWHIRYPLSSGQGHLVVATTRPETLLGDVAVAVHPDDERYQALIGTTVKLPLTEREIPIIADDYVDKSFGTGCVKITPAHDFNDYEVGKRHQLPMISIFTLDAKLNENTPSQYQGLDRFVAREKIVTDLKQLGLLENIQPHTLHLPKGDRSGVVIEPMLTYQWFVKMQSLAEPAIQAVDQGQIKFTPENWSKTYLQWLTNIQDWCISRQLWWGHRIPVWYDDAGNHYVGMNELDARQRHHLSAELKLTQDQDVLDTWFSASLWPFATLGWPDKTEDLKLFYPSDVLVTGFDIIFFWVARMVMMSLKLTGKIPFKDVFVTGLIRDSQGQKMSKTKGNVLDPLDIIDGIALNDLIKKRTSGMMQPQLAERISQQTAREFSAGISEHGTDALRFTYCALATHGRDVNFDLARVEGYRNFCNKIWNAARFVRMHTEAQDLDLHKPLQFSLADRWIRARLNTLIEDVHGHFKSYRFDLLAQALYEFTWNEYCDWYLELAKCDLTNPLATPAQLRGTRVSLLEVLEKLLRLMHPIMPFITEEIWQNITPLIDHADHASDFIADAPYPTKDPDLADKTAAKTIDWLKQLIVAIRTIRSEMNISPAKRIMVILNKGSSKDHEYVLWCAHYIKHLAKISELRWAHENEDLSASATAVLDGLDCHIPLADLIDKEAECQRLTKEIEKLSKEVEKSSTKLANENYVNKAPAVVVAKEREALAQALANLEKLQQQLANINALRN